MPNRRELGYVSAGSTSTIVATTGYGVATGGSSSSISVGGQNYTLLTFTSDDTLTVTSAGLFDVLLIGGGGGAGGPVSTNSSGGGGGGGVVGVTSLLTIYLSANQSIDVGTGGAGAASNSRTGTNFGLSSAIGTVVSVAGGGYGINRQAFSTGGLGASGGGAVFDDAFAGAAVNGGQSMQPIAGNNGGNSFATNTSGSGGGGGAGGVGGNGASTTGGAGGNGIDISGFTATSYFAGAGGGGGGTVTGGTAGSGGVAGKTSGTGNAGVNYGAGGGGTAGTATGGAGAAGAVFVRFKV